MEQPEYIEQPQHDADDHDGVQNGLNASCHGDVSVHEPQENAHDNQGYQNLNERHTFYLPCLDGETLPHAFRELQGALPARRTR